jgi:hypothetical protein
MNVVKNFVGNAKLINIMTANFVHVAEESCNILIGVNFMCSDSFELGYS